jgi:hypothetical protein
MLELLLTLNPPGAHAMVIKPKAAEFTTTEVEHMASIFIGL